MAEPKGLSFGGGNEGLGTAVTGMWKPAFAVSQQQKQEAELKKRQEAAAKQKALEGNDQFGEDLFKEKFNSLDTQRNEYKNQLLTQLRDNYNQANLKYSAEGRSIPLPERQELERQLQSFKSEWEQIETAYNFTQGVLKQAEFDKTGIHNVNAFRTVLMDIPTKEDGTIDFSKYNEKHVEQKIKENADVLYNLPKAADEYAKTLAETTLASVRDLGDGRHEEITDKFSGLIKLHPGKNGKPTPYAPDGSIHLDVSNEAIGLARKHPVIGAAMDAMVKKGKAKDYIDAYQQVASGQIGVEQKIDRQGTVKEPKDKSGYSSPRPKVEVRFNTIHRAITNGDTDALAQMFDDAGVDAEFRMGPFAPGKNSPDVITIKRRVKYNERVHENLTPDKNGFVTTIEDIKIASDKDKREAYFKINKYINSTKDRTASEVVPNDDIQLYMNEVDKNVKDVLGIDVPKKSDPLNLGL